MGINFSDKHSANTNATPSNATEEFVKPTFQQSSVTTPIRSFGLVNRLAGNGSGGETFEKLYEYFQRQVKQLNEGGKFEEQYNVIKMLKQNTGLIYSCVILTETLNSCTTAHILMVEKTGEAPQKVIENINGTRYEIIHTPADALDEKCVANARIVIADYLGVNANNVTIVDGVLVPNEFDVNSEEMLLNLLSNTLSAVMSETSTRVKDYSGINITQFLQDNPRGKFYLNLNVNGTNEDHFDQVGMPVREDICLALSYRTNTTSMQNSVHQSGGTLEIMKIYGYIDFECVSANVIPGMGYQAPKFVPNFIITHMESQMALTPDLMFLGILSLFVLNEDMNWMKAFRPTPARKNEIDFNDIGGLNIEANVENSPTGFGKKFDTKSKTTTMLELTTFISQTVHPNISISIDIPRAGPDTWFTSILSYLNVSKRQDVFNRLNNHIVTLTNGLYQPTNIPLFTDVVNKIHGGYYRDGNNKYRDIRHLSSYLAVANFISDTNQPPLFITQYTNTLYNKAIPAELRSAERKKIIDEMSGKTACYKQTYDRLTFQSGALMAMLKAVKDAGYSPIMANINQNDDMFHRRSVGDFSSAMLSGDASILGQTSGYNNYFGGINFYQRPY